MGAIDCQFITVVKGAAAGADAQGNSSITTGSTIGRQWRPIVGAVLSAVPMFRPVV